MKKLFCILITISLLLSFSGCRDDKDTNVSSNSITSELLSSDASDTIEEESSSQQNESEDVVSSNESQSDSSNDTVTNPSADSKPVTTTPSKPSTSQSPSQPSQPEPLEDWEILNRDHPVEGERKWKFYTIDSSYHLDKDFCYEDDLVECEITMDEVEGVTIFWNFYRNLKTHPELEANKTNTIMYNDVEYDWCMALRVEGSCFVHQGGAISVELKCWHDLQLKYVYDEIYFRREGPDKLVVTKHVGDAFKLEPGDTFTR